MLHQEEKLFDSRGCLVLVHRDYIESSEFTIYKMTKGCSVWLIKYIVDTDDFMTKLPKGWLIRHIVWSLVVGEREEDSFLVMNFFGKVVQYNIISKTVSEIYDMGSNKVADDYLHGFIPPFAMYDIGYKKLDHKVSLGRGEKMPDLMDYYGSEGGRKDPFKVTDIELTAHMIAVTNQRDSVSQPPLAAKPKKGKSQTVTSTLPKSQGPKASRALSKKRKRPKSKNPPTETMVTLPKTTEGSEQSYSVSLGTVPDPQDLERDIQLASTRLPSTLDEGTRKSKHLPESTTTHPKDSRGNKLPFNRDITSTTPDEGMTKTTPRPEGSLRDKDSMGNIQHVDMEPIHTLVVMLLILQGLVLTFLHSEDELEKESNEEEVLAAGDDMDEDSHDDAEEQHEEAAVSYVDLKASIEEYYEENIAHRDHTDQLVASSMSSLDKSSSSISDLYKGLNVITELLKDINNAVKDGTVTNKKIDKAIKTFAKFSAQTTKILLLVKTFDFATLYSQATLGIDKGKRIATESEDDPSKKLMHASTIICPDPDEPIRVEFMNNGKNVYLTEQDIQERYERLKKIPEEFGIKYALPTSILEQVSSQTSGRKSKHMELKPEIKVHGPECNRSLPKGVPFVSNMVIEEPGYGIFLTNVFGD
nr:F-box protein At5g07610-like [Tanacetum cinerariifolium]